LYPLQVLVKRRFLRVDFNSHFTVRHCLIVTETQQMSTQIGLIVTTEGREK